VVVKPDSTCEERRESALEYALALDAVTWVEQVGDEISQLRRLLGYELKRDCSGGGADYEEWRKEQELVRKRLKRIRTAEQAVAESFYDLELSRLGVTD